jgi:CHASE2 domain-containing sensor protein
MSGRVGRFWIVMVLAGGCGFALWGLSATQRWRTASYDYSFPFISKPTASNVVLILMDNDSYGELKQTRGQPWDRGLHAELLTRLAADKCPLVILDFFLGSSRDAESDRLLAKALERLDKVVLMGKQVDALYPGAASARPLIPAEPFLTAAKGKWGVAWFDPDPDKVVRKHWPFPSPGPYPSLPEVAVRLAGGKVASESERKWLRYYVEEGAWTTLSYRFAREQPKNYFQSKIVFVANKPATSVPGDEREDEFRTPYTSTSGRAVGGVELLATEFLNLLHDHSLRRLPWLIELVVLVVCAGVFGTLIFLPRRAASCGIAILTGFAVLLGAVFLSKETNYWFPWLIVVGGQLPCFLTVLIFQKDGLTSVKLELPLADEEISDYTLSQAPFARGGFGEIWLAQSAIGQWQALKKVYRSNFEDERPYEIEFEGVKKYKPISEMYPNLLRVEFVSGKKVKGYFYYIMELADAQELDWENDPTKYQPRTLSSERGKWPKGRLPVNECLNLGIELAKTLECLHSHSLTHRDIKPSNVVFVKGSPKLADIGLVTHARSGNSEATRLGTPGYMPNPPEPQGTIQADIYALGMLLYVISTGREPCFFPELSTTLLECTGENSFMPFNRILTRACHPDCSIRYASVKELRTSLETVGKDLERREVTTSDRQQR